MRKTKMDILKSYCEVIDSGDSCMQVWCKKAGGLHIKYRSIDILYDSIYTEMYVQVELSLGAL